jgi:hypothetical protein
MAFTIKTRFLILSDTHGQSFEPENRPRQSADVVLHCGDLTDGSKLAEFRTTLEMIKDIHAPLKLVIAGNHDFTMDIPVFETKLAEATTSEPLESDLVTREYGAFGQVQQMFDDAKTDGVCFLDEGTHRFRLENGASLTVYASPYTPALGAWGFQYHPNTGRSFDIADDTDIVMTHGPPRGVMDFTSGRERAGCPDLFAAVTHVRPRMHCFGHIHEGWGAKLVTWKDSGLDRPSHFTAIDNEHSTVIASLASLRSSSFDSEEDTAEKQLRLNKLAQDKCAMTSHGVDDEHPLLRGEQTLFINASIEGEEGIFQRPWIVDIELDKATVVSDR